MKRLFFILFQLTVTYFSASSQNIAEKLQNSFIWSGNNDIKGSFTVFRKSFEIINVKSATLNIFADVRYTLWINGTEVLRGPCRFDPKGPQYDFTEVSKYLKKGSNTIAVLVMSHGSNGKMMDHTPGLTLSLEINTGSKPQTIKTDETWLSNNHTRYLPAQQSWGFICDRIDARLDDGDWTSTAYNDAKWLKAKKIDGSQWGKLVPRQIPLLGKWNVPVRMYNGSKFSNEITSGKSVIIELERMAQGYASFDFEAVAGDSIIVEVGYIADSSNILTAEDKAINIYIAKAGRQHYTMTESYGFRYIKVTSKNNPVKLYSVKVTDRRYPYTEAGRFECSDAFLTELWKRASLTMRMNSEDGYMDCALREKTEWMGDAAVVEYPVSRVLFGYAYDGKGIRSDAGLMKNMIRHIGQSQTNSGTFKAHHPSDRWDIHGYIEDYSCLWVQSLRQVYDNTGDIKLVQEVWEPLKKQMQWFINHQASSGLLLAREFVIFDNPLAYIHCEGATLNAFFYKALIDAAYLADIISDKESCILYSAKADELYKSYNRNLWLNEKQTYSSGISQGKKLLPTAHAALLALYMGIVPDERKQQVETFLLDNYNNSGKEPELKSKNALLDSAFNINSKANGVEMPYTAFWLLDVLYKTDHDSLALNFIRSKWPETMKNKQTGTLSEGFGGGDLCHNFGTVPAYFLSTKVLGVSTLLPLKNNQIQIKPQLGGLSHAEGSVVTEHGVIEVRWDKSNGNLKFKITIPKGITAKVLLPKLSTNSTLIINNKKIQCATSSNYLAFELSDGCNMGEEIE